MPRVVVPLALEDPMTRSTDNAPFFTSSPRRCGGVNPHSGPTYSEPPRAARAVATVLATDPSYEARLEAQRRGEGRDLLHRAVVRVLESRALRELNVTHAPHIRAIAWRACAFAVQDRLREIYAERRVLAQLEVEP